MFDTRYFAYVAFSAVLVISPGASMAVVLKTAIENGRKAAFSTVIGVNIGNSSLALLSALGMAVVFRRWPWALQAVKVGGACYLTWLGARGLLRALQGVLPVSSSTTYQVPSTSTISLSTALSSFVARGIATNLLNPSVIIFYMTLLPQFISHDDPFFERFLVLAATHIIMSLVWLTLYAVSIGTLSEQLARPAVRRWMAGMTGAVLMLFGINLVLR